MARALHYAGVLRSRGAHRRSHRARWPRARRIQPRLRGDLGIVLPVSSRSRRRSTPGRRSRSIRHANTEVTSACCWSNPECPAEQKRRIAAMRSSPATSTPALASASFSTVGRTEEAAACFCKVITLRPKYARRGDYRAGASCSATSARRSDLGLAGMEGPGPSSTRHHAHGLRQAATCPARHQRYIEDDHRTGFRRLRVEAAEAVVPRAAPHRRGVEQAGLGLEAPERVRRQLRHGTLRVPS